MVRLLLLLLFLAACGRAPISPLERWGFESPGEEQDAGTTDAARVDASSEPACTTHSECPCPEGICFSNGQCFCPPCETEEDCAPGQVCRYGNCVDFDPDCVAPVRIEPDRGPTTGGTLLSITGSEFQIGALEWWTRIGDGPPLMPFAYSSLCRLVFLTPPMPAGRYPVSVAYGGRPPEGGDPAGYFTYESFDGPVGHGFCRAPVQCDVTDETCDIGTGRCVPDICRATTCPDGCDSVEGCLPPNRRCNDSSDCRLVRSSCSCQAVHLSDPRDRITSCALLGCETCAVNHCDTEQVEAICLNGICTERRGDPTGVACEALEHVVLAPFASTGRIAEPHGTAHGNAAMVAWTQTDELSSRNGIVGVVALEADGSPRAPLALLDGPGGRDSAPSVASNGRTIAVSWVSEQPNPSLFFQQIDDHAHPIGVPVLVSERADEAVGPVLLPHPNGFEAFWMRQNWTDDDGLYHALLSNDGRPGVVDYDLWILASLEDFAAVRQQERSVIAWPSNLRELPGLYLTDYPLRETPVHRLAEEGTSIAMAPSGLGFAVVWREMGPITRGTVVYFQAFDQDTQPTSEVIQVARNVPMIYQPRVAYLGGIYLVSWFEIDGYQEPIPYRLMTAQLSETGRRIVAPVPLETIETRFGNQLHVRLPDTIMSGAVHGGGSSDSLLLYRWSCSP